jgi:hypothetical protein
LEPSDCTSTQLVPHIVRPFRHVHAPPVHASPVSHATPHAPHAVALVEVSTQPLPQSAEPAGHEQLPFEQD